MATPGYTGKPCISDDCTNHVPCNQGSDYCDACITSDRPEGSRCKMKYRVIYDQAVWERASILVEADSAEHAEELVMNGEGDVEWTDIRDSVFTLDIEVQSCEKVTP